MKIEEQGISVKKYVDDNEYRIIGLPFFNKDSSMEEFQTVFEKVSKGEL